MLKFSQIPGWYMKSYSNFVLQFNISFFTKLMNSIHKRHVASVCPSMHTLYLPYYWTAFYDTWVRGGAVGWGTGTSRKVAGSIPNDVIGIFHWHNPSGRTMALGLTQPLTEMSTNISWGGKSGRCIGLTTLPTTYADVKWFYFKVKWSEVKWSEVKWSEVKWSEVKWSELRWSSCG